MNVKKRQDYLDDLIYGIEKDSIDSLFEDSGEWGGAHVIITSDEEKAMELMKGEEDSKSGDLYVLSQNSESLSGLFNYVKENVMPVRDNYLYAFMALSAIDFIRRYGDDDSISLLKYIVQNIKGYLAYFDWKSAMGDKGEAFKVMRYYLSSQVTDDEISFML